ncbi:MAG: glycosyltransferase [Muribaculaceae bacterium]|nr:glycosyltransferase [Muribaculaceae bacterium]
MAIQISYINQEVWKYIDKIEASSKTNPPILVVRCATFNQEKYIGTTLEGFVTQKTKFPFIVIVHDDASTDNTPNIIKEYSEKYPHLIFPIFEVENLYSKGQGDVSKILTEACNRTGAKYIALCEGDDYWIDPLKLQKQVDFLEKHVDYSLVATNTDNLNGTSIIPSKWNVTKDGERSIKEVILNGGLFLSTASLVFRADIYRQMPETAKTLHVGDYPLQIFMASKGRVWQLADTTCVYRVQSDGSWTQNNKTNMYNYDFIRHRITKETYLLETMDKVTEGKYTSLFRQRKNLYIYNSLFLFNGWKCFNAFFKNPYLILQHNSLKHILLSFLPQRIKRKYLGR